MTAAAPVEDSPTTLRQILDLQAAYFQQIESLRLDTEVTHTPSASGHPEFVTVVFEGDRFYWRKTYFEMTLGRPVTDEVMFDGERYLAVDWFSRHVVYGGVIARRYDPLCGNILTEPFLWAERRGEEFSYRAMRRSSFWADPTGFRVLSSRTCDHRGNECIELTLDASGRPGGIPQAEEIVVRFAAELGYYPLYQEYRMRDLTGQELYTCLTVEVAEHVTVESHGNRIVVPTRVERVFRVKESPRHEPRVYLRGLFVVRTDRPLAVNEPIDRSMFTTSLDRPGFLAFDVRTQQAHETATTTFEEHERLINLESAAPSGETSVRVLAESAEPARSSGSAAPGTGHAALWAGYLAGLLMIGVGTLIVIFRR